MTRVKKAQTTTPKCNTGRTAANVYRIFHFQNRFEMDGDYRRQGGLDYVRMFITASTQGKSNESSAFMRQLGMLEHYYPEQWDAYLGRFWRLVALTATQEDWLRGYLLDSDQRPLADAKLAAAMHLSLPVMKATLQGLRKVGLIEQVPCPQFTRPKKRKAKDESANQKQNKDGKKKSPKKPKKQTAKQTVRKHSETFGNISERSETLRAKTNKTKTAKAASAAKDNPRAAPSDYNQKATNGKTAVGCKRKTNDKRQGETTGAEALQNRTKCEWPTQSRTASAPATAPPLPSEPQQSDDGERVIPFVRSPDSAELSRQGMSYGRRVYLALGYGWDINSPEASREIASFASKHDELCRKLSGLPPPQLDAMLCRGLREAEKMSRRRANRNRGAVWNTAMNRLIAKHAGAWSGRSQSG